MIVWKKNSKILVISSFQEKYEKRASNIKYSPSTERADSYVKNIKQKLYFLENQKNQKKSINSYRMPNIKQLQDKLKGCCLPNICRQKQEDRFTYAEQNGENIQISRKRSQHRINNSFGIHYERSSLSMLKKFVSRQVSKNNSITQSQERSVQKLFGKKRRQGIQKKTKIKTKAKIKTMGKQVTKYNTPWKSNQPLPYLHDYLQEFALQNS